MGGTGVGRVESSNVEGIAPGDLVTGPTGWQDYAVLAARDARPVDADVDPALHLSLFGVNGLTAYFGLLDVGRPQPGETVVVSAAAGSVGHLVGQLARVHGCRVVGVTGSPDKCRFLTEDLGFDAAVDHRSATFRGDLKAATPDGVDIYFDNTGGDILGTALRRMRAHGWIVCCGVVSQYDTSEPAPGPRGIPGLLVNNRVRMEGFLVFDFAGRYDEARARLRDWLDGGRIRSVHDELSGLESAPRAFVDLLGGGNIGTRIVRVAD
jgi:NADPH-dependent curcumin reductase CurA